MTKEEKTLFIKDLCARLPYGIWFRSFHSECNIEGKGTFNFYIDINTENATIKLSSFCDPYSDNNKPYLRPLYSMTKSEAIEMFNLMFPNSKYLDCEIIEDRIRFRVTEQERGFHHTVLFFNKIYSLEQLDFLNAHHFDYNGLIDMGIAIEAPEDMYLYNQQA